MTGLPDADPGALTVEATGETVGEAKWAALRELERRRPGLDRAAVRFEVVTEGERGLLGVGYAPARVVAHLPTAAAADAGEGGQVAEARDLVSRIVAALGLEATVEAREDADAIVVSCTGPDVGLLIGRRGQTLDAIQDVLNAIGWRAYGAARKAVVVDAAGYRARRAATLEARALQAAERVRATGEPEPLEPMSPLERKIVHLRVQAVPGVTTVSEGAEPNRYVVVVPEHA